MEKPKVRVLDSGLITKDTDILRLNIVDWNRLNGMWANIGEALETISSWLINKVQYTIVETRLGAAPKRDDWPGWEHEGSHEELGRLYYNWFKAYQEGEIAFSDEPDFHGRLYTRGTCCQFWGDIGIVSASCFAMTIKGLDKGDLWISIPHQAQQIILEAKVSLIDAWGEMLHVS